MKLFHHGEVIHCSEVVDQSVHGSSSLDNCSTVSLKVTKSVPYSLYQYSTVSPKIAKSVCPGAVPWSRASQCRSPCPCWPIPFPRQCVSECSSLVARWPIPLPG